MPLVLRENINHAEIGLWKITEETEELLILAQLSGQDLLTYAGISAHHRQKEWLATRALLKTLIEMPRLICYHHDGRPYLENCTTNLSISHSTGYIAIILQPSVIPGIDIELITRQVGKVASRFLSADELSACNATAERSNHRMLMHWCAKEAIFKMVPLSNIEFSTDIKISLTDISDDSGCFEGVFNNQRGPIPIQLYYKIFREVLIVWGWIDESQFNSLSGNL